MYKSRWKKKLKLGCNLMKHYENKSIFTLKSNSLKQIPLLIFSEHRIFVFLFYNSETTRL